MLQPYPSAPYVDIAAEFPEERAALVEGDKTQLSVPITPEHLPGMTGRQITGVYARCELAGDGQARFLLNGDRRVALDNGKLLHTPSLTTGGWTLKGDKNILPNLGLILTHRASA
jgi:hypothetical protein